MQRTEKIWNGEVSKRLPQNNQNIARRKLRILNNAIDLNDLRIPPANHLEALKDNLKGSHSIRITNSGESVFKWNDGALDVQIIYYH